jgi:hypothetical protein
MGEGAKGEEPVQVDKVEEKVEGKVEEKREKRKMSLEQVSKELKEI